MEPSFPIWYEAADADIHFHCEDVPDPGIISTQWTAWIKLVVTQHQATLGSLQYIFCSDDYLHQINVEHLAHDTLTDIITFPYSEPPLVSGDIFISTERVADNARELNIPFAVELRRVLIHGVLHLCGYPDKQVEEAARMRKFEDEALALYNE